MPPPLPPWDGFGKKTLKSKGASAPAASAIPASNEPRPARPGTARPGPQVPPNGLLQPGRPSLGGGGDFYDVAFKVMLVGDSGVGKTCLLVRFKDGAFLAGTFISTVGIDFRNKVLDVDGMKVKLQIWDTAGQERFRSVTHAYYRDAHALLLLYDVTNKASFDNIQAQMASGSQRVLRTLLTVGRGKGPSGLLVAPVEYELKVAWVTFQLHQLNTLDKVPVRDVSAWHMAWLTEIQEYAQHDVVLMLLGNKVDSTQERVVKREDGEKLAKVSWGKVGGQGVPLWGRRAWAVPMRLPPCWQQLFAGIWATFHGDQCQDRPQRGLSLHSHSKGVEAAFYEGPQRAPLPAARLCQEGGPCVLLLQTLNLDENSHQAFCWEAQVQPSH
ncbi:ras-related protein Rab-26 isoform X2 [Pteropus medius]|uniref:ras-related protein Rab-26 isoform X2 n=1 Tax=Pteropus vampyrus TaxID=132908 RepID=UPI00196ABA91|nr:ras-related protein Rab-26 isoform X2 [Pteropus giganteus]